MAARRRFGTGVAAVRSALLLLLLLLVFFAAADDVAAAPEVVVEEEVCAASKNGTTSNNETTTNNNGSRRSSQKEVLDACRRVPAWKTTSSSSSSGGGGGEEEDKVLLSPESCADATGYHPPGLDRLLVGAEEQYTETKEWYGTIVSCIKDATRQRCKQQRDDASSCDVADPTIDDDDQKPIAEPQITGLYPLSREKAVMATVEYALTEVEAALVQDLSACVRKFHPDMFEERVFEYAVGDGDDPNADQGGNDVTFLAGFLQVFAPGVAAQLHKIAHLVWETAGWGNVTQDGYGNQVEYPDPYRTGIRTTEHLSYERWGNLGQHADTESLYTVLVALAEPGDYEGGAYYIQPKPLWRNDFTISLKPNRLSAIVFLSEENHGVRKIVSGKREMFTNELWAYEDVTFGITRPSIDRYEYFKRTGSWLFVEEEESGESDAEEDEDENGEVDEETEEDEEGIGD